MIKNKEKLLKYGIVAGLLMGGFIGILSMIGNYSGSPLKYLKYLLLIVVLVSFYNRFRPKNVSRKYIFEHIISGATISFIAALILVATNTLLYVMNPEFSAAKYSLFPKSSEALMLIDVTMFIETFVLGIISAYIIFPIYKPKLQEIRSK